MQRSTRIVSVLMGAAALALSFTGYASEADNDPYTKRVEVSYRDLDLTKVADAKQLYTRIDRAANHVCRTDFGITSRTEFIKGQCKAKAVEDAVHQVGDANLTAVYLERAGRRAMVASSR
jgi:UrcA family protein